MFANFVFISEWVREMRMASRLHSYVFFIRRLFQNQLPPTSQNPLNLKCLLLLIDPPPLLLLLLLLLLLHLLLLKLAMAMLVFSPLIASSLLTSAGSRGRENSGTCLIKSLVYIRNRMSVLVRRPFRPIRLESRGHHVPWTTGLPPPCLNLCRFLGLLLIENHPILTPWMLQGRRLRGELFIFYFYLFVYLLILILLLKDVLPLIKFFFKIKIFKIWMGSATEFRE